MADHGLNTLLQRLERLLTVPIRTRSSYLHDDPARDRREEIEALEAAIDATIEASRRRAEAMDEPGVVIGGLRW